MKEQHEGGSTLKSDPEASIAAPLDWQSVTQLEAPLRTSFAVEPARTMRAEGFEWEHEIRVALPLSYAHTTKSYPVLWITDNNNLEVALSILGGMDLILVSVGSGRISNGEWQTRRTYDFCPDEDYLFGGPAGEYVRANSPPEWLMNKGGGAARFLDFLIDDVRPTLMSEYRMDSADHGIVGYSGGGTFVGYALFARPGGFSRYLCGSPGLYHSNYSIFELEKRYAEEHNDLRAHVFLGAGEAEITEPFINGLGLVSSMVKMAETLSFRGYPSLRLGVKVFSGESHGTTFPSFLSWGVRFVWGDTITYAWQQNHAPNGSD
jgi:predicted alpha/beta superfamily hydrolase